MSYFTPSATEEGAEGPQNGPKEGLVVLRTSSSTIIQNTIQNVSFIQTEFRVSSDQINNSRLP